MLDCGSRTRDGVGHVERTQQATRERCELFVLLYFSCSGQYGARALAVTVWIPASSARERMRFWHISLFQLFHKIASELHGLSALPRDGPLVTDRLVNRPLPLPLCMLQLLEVAALPQHTGFFSMKISPLFVILDARDLPSSPAKKAREGSSSLALPTLPGGWVLLWETSRSLKTRPKFRVFTTEAGSNRANDFLGRLLL